jgi:hypothetical protein
MLVLCAELNVITICKVFWYQLQQAQSSRQDMKPISNLQDTPLSSFDICSEVLIV